MLTRNVFGMIPKEVAVFVVVWKRPHDRNLFQTISIVIFRSVQMEYVAGIYERAVQIDVKEILT